MLLERWTCDRAGFRRRFRPPSPMGSSRRRCSTRHIRIERYGLRCRQPGVVQPLGSRPKAIRCSLWVARIDVAPLTWARTSLLAWSHSLGMSDWGEYPCVCVCTTFCSFIWAPFEAFSNSVTRFVRNHNVRPSKASPLQGLRAIWSGMASAASRSHIGPWLLFGSSPFVLPLASPHFLMLSG